MLSLASLSFAGHPAADEGEGGGGAEPLTATVDPTTLSWDVSGPPYVADGEATAEGVGGSGDYSYAWPADGTSGAISPNSATTGFYSFSADPQSFICEVTDNVSLETALTDPVEIS
jgi:hypothetical protein